MWIYNGTRTRGVRGGLAADSYGTPPLECMSMQHTDPIAVEAVLPERLKPREQKLSNGGGIMRNDVAPTLNVHAPFLLL